MFALLTTKESCPCERTSGEIEWLIRPRAEHPIDQLLSFRFNDLCVVDELPRKLRFVQDRLAKSTRPSNEHRTKRLMPANNFEERTAQRIDVQLAAKTNQCGTMDRSGSYAEFVHEPDTLLRKRRWRGLSIRA